MSSRAETGQRLTQHVILNEPVIYQDVLKVVNDQPQHEDEIHLNFRRDLSLFVSNCTVRLQGKSMARQIPSKSKHRIMAEQSTRTSRHSSKAPSTTARSNRTSTCTTIGVQSNGMQACGRSEHHKDNCAAQSPPRALETSGSPQGLIDTSLETTESTPLVPAIIHVPRRTSTSTVSWVLEPLLRSPIDSANDIGSTVMEQLQAFFARQGDFNKRLEEWLKEHLQGQGRENTQTVQATSFSKALSVSHLSSKIKFNFNYFSLVYRLFSLPAIKQFKS